jgi:hypothetical protein
MPLFALVHKSSISDLCSRLYVTCLALPRRSGPSVRLRKLCCFCSFQALIWATIYFTNQDFYGIVGLRNGKGPVRSRASENCGHPTLRYHSGVHSATGEACVGRTALSQTIGSISHFQYRLIRTSCHLFLRIAFKSSSRRFQSAMYEWQLINFFQSFGHGPLSAGLWALSGGSAS